MDNYGHERRLKQILEEIIETFFSLYRSLINVFQKSNDKIIKQHIGKKRFDSIVNQDRLTSLSSLVAASPMFVAREKELKALDDALDKAQVGQGQICFVTGESGEGKSALGREFARRAQKANPDLIVVGGDCIAGIGKGIPYLPFQEVLDMLAGNRDAMLAGEKITFQHSERLRRLTPSTLTELTKHAPDLVIQDFVSRRILLNRAALIAAEEEDPLWFKRLKELDTKTNVPGINLHHSFMTQYTALIKSLAIQHPILLILENLHWIDDASINLLFYLCQQLRDSRILIVGTCRQCEMPKGIIDELKRLYGVNWLDLDDLTLNEKQRFLVDYLNVQMRPNRFSQSFKERLYHKTKGHPLFTMALLQEIKERGYIQKTEAGYWATKTHIDWQNISPKIEEVIRLLISRLDKEAQRILAVASIEGETFTAEVIAQVLQIDNAELEHQLIQKLDLQHNLVKFQTKEHVTNQQLSLYRFRHYSFQDYLYRYHLNETERIQLHKAVGRALEAKYQEQTKEVAGQLAHHFKIAKDIDKAITYFYEAGERAASLSSHGIAAGHFIEGLRLLEELPTPGVVPTKKQFSSQVTHYNVANIHSLLNKGFTNEELNCFCYDIPESLPIYRQLTTNLSKASIIDKLLTLADQKSQLETVIIFAKRSKPTEYEKYRPYYDNPTNLFTGKVTKELRLLLGLGSSLIVIKGYADPKVGRIYNRAQVLYKQLSEIHYESPELFPFLRMLWYFHLTRANHQTAKQVAEQALLVVKQEKSSDLYLGLAYDMLGSSLLLMGKLEPSLRSMKQAISSYSAQSRSHHTSPLTYIQNPRVTALMYSACALAWLGRPDQALKHGQLAIKLAKEDDHPFSLTHALIVGGAMIHQFRGEYKEALYYAERGIKLATKYSFLFWELVGRIMRGRALIEFKQDASYLTEINEGLSMHKVAGAQIAHSYYYGLLAESYNKVGQPRIAIEMINKALSFVNDTKEDFYTVELFRLKGELLLAISSTKGNRVAAKGYFMHGLKKAHKENLKLWELRTALSLGRLLHQEGQDLQAYKLVDNIYCQFKEGHNTEDVREAKRFLQALER